MGKKIITALGSDIINNYLSKKQYEVIEDIPYQEYGYHFAENSFRKRAEIGYDGWTYTLQINAIHSPDSVDAYIRETTCLKPFLK